MKKLISIFVLLSACLTQVAGQVSSYRPGEKVNYIIHYGAINGGVAVLDLRRDSFSGKEVWHSAMEARTTGVADALYKVKDTYESFINPVTELPVKSIRNVNEGRYHRYNVVLFDHDTRKDSAILTSDLTGIHITPQGIHDILSCFYWFRNHDLPNMDSVKKGDMIQMTTWFTDELYPIRMKYICKEEIKTRAGKILCYKFNPVTEVGRLFKTQEDVSFWFSSDKNFLPVKIRFDIFVGAFTVDLVSYEGLIYPLDIKKK
jgi:hypothetical protein